MHCWHKALLLTSIHVCPNPNWIQILGNFEGHQCFHSNCTRCMCSFIVRGISLKLTEVCFHWNDTELLYCCVQLKTGKAVFVAKLKVYFLFIWCYQMPCLCLPKRESTKQNTNILFLVIQISLRLFSSIAFANDETNFPFMLALADTDRKKQKTVNLIFKLGANKSHQHHCCALFPQWKNRNVVSQVGRIRRMVGEMEFRTPACHHENWEKWQAAGKSHFHFSRNQKSVVGGETGNAGMTNSPFLKNATPCSF